MEDEKKKTVSKDKENMDINVDKGKKLEDKTSESEMTETDVVSELRKDMKSLRKKLKTG